MKPVPWTGADVLRALGWMILLGILPAVAVITIGVVVSRAGYSFAGAPYRFGLSTLILSMMVYGAALYCVYRSSIKKYGVPWSALGFEPVGIRTLALTAFGFPMMAMGLAAVSTLSRLALGREIENPQTAGLEDLPRHWLNAAGFLIAGAVIAPIVEEIVFRGFLYRWLRKKMRPWPAIVVSAALFAALHGIWVIFPMLFYLGVVFAWVVEHTRSLYCSILLHAMQNGIVLTALLVFTKH